MPGEERYDDEHRIFLQGLMCKGILNFKVAHVIISCHRQTANQFQLPSASKKVNFFAVSFYVTSPFVFQENMQLMEVALTKCQVFFFYR
jgi:hypothetical protein